MKTFHFLFLWLLKLSSAYRNAFEDRSFPFPPTSWSHRSSLKTICEGKKTRGLCEDTSTYLSGQSCAQDASTGFGKDVNPSTCPVTRYFLTSRKYAKITANLEEMVQKGAIWPRLADSMLISPCGVALSTWARAVYDHRDITVPLFNQVDCELEYIDLRRSGDAKAFKADAEDPNGPVSCANIGCNGQFPIPNSFRVDPPSMVGGSQFARILQKPMWTPVSTNTPHNATFKMVNLILANFTEWCTFLPVSSGDTDNGLTFIKNFNQFSTATPTGNALVRGNLCLGACPTNMELGNDVIRGFVDEGADYPVSKVAGSCPPSDPWLINSLQVTTSNRFDINFFANMLVHKNFDRGAFMDSTLSTFAIPGWVNNPRSEAYIFYRAGCDPNGVPSKARRQWGPRKGEFWIDQNLDCDAPTKFGSLKEVTGHGVGWTSWNDYFSRHIRLDKHTQTIPSRPVTQPKGSGPAFGDRQAGPGNGPTSAKQSYNYEISAPTDCIMNPLYEYVSDNPVNYYANKFGGAQYGGARRVTSNFLSQGTVVDVKGFPISAMALLGNAPSAIKKQFEGGTGIVCILMPNTYHNYHSPVDGVVEHAEIMKLGDIVGDSRSYGQNQVKGVYGAYDFPNFDPSNVGNVGGAGSDHSQWNDFQRSVVIFNVSYTGACSTDGKQCRVRTGHVASINVGLDTVGSVTFDPAIKRGLAVKRAYTRIGGFYYGGSMNILLFSLAYEANLRGEFNPIANPAVKVRMGNSIAQFSDDESAYNAQNPYYAPNGVDPVYHTPFPGLLNPVTGNPNKKQQDEKHNPNKARPEYQGHKNH